MRAMLCGCHRHLEADDEGLFQEVLDHLKRNHPVVTLTDEQIRQTVAAHAYRLEYAAPYAGGEGPDEEFEPEPY